MQPDLTSSKELYDGGYFEEINDGSLSSAQVIVPHLMKLLKPKSVLDVGCAQGAWLSVFKAHGVNDICGIDGNYVERDHLLVDAKYFLAGDLEKEFCLGRRFDVAICLEVAEHLSTIMADQLVNSLVSHSDCIVFSASVPFQDGKGHINEQWPNYWAEKFHRAGYKAYDCLRSRIWNDARIRWWFAQNMLIYASPRVATENIGLTEETSHPLPLVHPHLLLHKEERLRRNQIEMQNASSRAGSLRWLARQTYKVMCARIKSNWR